MDVKTHRFLITAARRVWLWSLVRRQVIKEAKGEKDKHGESLYRCNICREMVPKIYVDHILPIIPTSGFDSWDRTYDRLFELENHQTLCKLCHDSKSKMEKKLRVKK